MLRLAVVIGLVAYAAAQSPSPQCTAALTTAAQDPGVSTCLATSALVPVVTAANGTSLVKPIDDWLTSMCSAPACTNDNLAVIVNALTSGCAAELTALKLPTDAATLLEYFKVGYPIFRKIACLKHGGTFCITETLTNIEKVAGPIAPDTIHAIFSTPPSDIPASIICTDCIKETYNLLSPVIKEPAYKSFFQSKCGDSFVDGQVPSDITVP